MSMKATVIDIEEIDALQSTKNEGRGVVCVKDIVSMLMKNREDRAEQIAIHDNDKIRNYPDLQLKLRAILPAYEARLVSFERAWEALKRIDEQSELPQKKGKRR